MSDLKLASSTNDLVMAGGNPATVDGDDAKAQRIRKRLLTAKGGWFADLDFGVDYLGIIWNKSVPRAVQAAHLKQQILLACVELGSTTTADRITDFNMELDGTTRNMVVSVTINGNITVTVG